MKKCRAPGSSAVCLGAELAADQEQYVDAASPQVVRWSRAAPKGREWSVQSAEAALADPGVAEALPAKKTSQRCD